MGTASGSEAPLEMVPDAKHGNAACRNRVAHDVIAEHHVANGLRIGRHVNGASHQRRIAQRGNASDEFSADPVRGSRIMFGNERAQPDQVFD